MSVESALATTSQSAEALAKELGAKVVLKKSHAEASRFPSREVFNQFISFLRQREYKFRLANSVSTEVCFRLPAASLSLRNLGENEFELGEL